MAFEPVPFTCGKIFCLVQPWEFDDVVVNHAVVSLAEAVGLAGEGTAQKVVDKYRAVCEARDPFAGQRQAQPKPSALWKRNAPQEDLPLGGDHHFPNALHPLFPDLRIYYPTKSPEAAQDLKELNESLDKDRDDWLDMRILGLEGEHSLFVEYNKYCENKRIARAARRDASLARKPWIWQVIVNIWLKNPRPRWRVRRPAFIVKGPYSARLIHENRLNRHHSFTTYPRDAASSADCAMEKYREYHETEISWIGIERLKRQWKNYFKGGFESLYNEKAFRETRKAYEKAVQQEMKEKDIVYPRDFVRVPVKDSTRHVAVLKEGKTIETEWPKDGPKSALVQEQELHERIKQDRKFKRLNAILEDDEIRQEDPWHDLTFSTTTSYAKDKLKRSRVRMKYYRRVHRLREQLDKTKVHKAVYDHQYVGHDSNIQITRHDIYDKPWQTTRVQRARKLMQDTEAALLQEAEDKIKERKRYEKLRKKAYFKRSQQKRWSFFKNHYNPTENRAGSRTSRRDMSSMGSRSMTQLSTRERRSGRDYRSTEDFGRRKGYQTEKALRFSKVDLDSKDGLSSKNEQHSDFSRSGNTTESRGTSFEVAGTYYNGNTDPVRDKIRDIQTARVRDEATSHVRRRRRTWLFKKEFVKFHSVLWLFTRPNRFKKNQKRPVLWYLPAGYDRYAVDEFEPLAELPKREPVILKYLEKAKRFKNEDPRVDVIQKIDHNERPAKHRREIDVYAPYEPILQKMKEGRKLSPEMSLAQKFYNDVMAGKTPPASSKDASDTRSEDSGWDDESVPIESDGSCSCSECCSCSHCSSCADETASEEPTRKLAAKERAPAGSDVVEIMSERSTPVDLNEVNYFAFAGPAVEERDFGVEEWTMHTDKMCAEHCRAMNIPLEGKNGEPMERPPCTVERHWGKEIPCDCDCENCTPRKLSWWGRIKKKYRDQRRMLKRLRDMKSDPMTQLDETPAPNGRYKTTALQWLCGFGEDEEYAPAPGGKLPGGNRAHLKREYLRTPWKTTLAAGCGCKPKPDEVAHGPQTRVAFRLDRWGKVHHIHICGVDPLLREKRFK